MLPANEGGIRPVSGVEYDAVGVMPRRRHMPTKLEESGIKAAAAMEAGGPPATFQTSALLGLMDTVRSTSVEVGDVASTSIENVIPTDIKSVYSVEMTSSLMRTLPDIKFKDQLVGQKPSPKLGRFNISWGYGLRTMPSSMKGAGFTDKYPYKLWMAKNVPRQSVGLKHTSIGYDNRITQNHKSEYTGSLTDKARPDDRQFQARFDEPKNLATEFRLAGNAKSVAGSNHIAWLTKAMLNIMALKQASEQGARCELEPMGDAVRDVAYLKIANHVAMRSSVASGTATVLANAWFGAVKSDYRGDDTTVPANMYEMILPGNAATVKDAVYLAYLSGHLDDKCVWKEGMDILDFHPIYFSFDCEVTKRIKVVLSNAARPIDAEKVAEWKGRIELGAAEAVLNEYVHRFRLHYQFSVAKQMAMSLMMGSRTRKSSRMILALPEPNHVEEYDLWDPVSLTQVPLSGVVTEHESACLLAVLLQIQATMRDDCYSTLLVEKLQTEEVELLSSGAQTVLDQWASDLMPSGYSVWLRSWHESVFGQCPAEMRRLCHNSKVGFLQDILVHLNSSSLRVSSLLYVGEKASSGALGYIWNEEQRNQASMLRYTTKSQAKVLEYLFRGDPDIMSAFGPNWTHFLGDLTRRRDQQKIDSALGVRTKNTLRGAPRIIFMGLKANVDEHNTRMAEAQDASGIVSHYEPVFDLNHPTYYSAAKVNLIKVSADNRHDGERGRSDNKPAIPGARESSSDINNKIKPDTTSFLGRLFNKAKPSDIIPGPGAYAPDEEPRRRIPEGKSPATVTGYTVRNTHHAHNNGLRDSNNTLLDASKARLDEAQSMINRPDSYKATEIVNPNPEQARENGHQVYDAMRIESDYVGLTYEQYRAMMENLTKLEVDGDGRCGVRSLHASYNAMNPFKTAKLEEMSDTEKEVTGYVGAGLMPGTHMPDDFTMAAICARANYALAIIHFTGNKEAKTKGIRYYRAPHMKNSSVLYILREDAHFSGLKVDRGVSSAYSALTGKSAMEILSLDVLSPSNRPSSPSPTAENHGKVTETGSPIEETHPDRDGGNSSDGDESSDSDLEDDTGGNSGARDPTREPVGASETGPAWASQANTPYVRYEPDVATDLAMGAAANKVINSRFPTAKITIIKPNKLVAKQRTQWAERDPKPRYDVFNDLPRRSDRTENMARFILGETSGLHQQLVRSGEITDEELLLYAVAENYSCVVVDMSTIPSQFGKVMINSYKVHDAVDQPDKRKLLITWIRFDGKIGWPNNTEGTSMGLLREVRDIIHYETRASYRDPYANSKSAVESPRMIGLSAGRTHAAWEQVIKTKLIAAGMVKAKQELPCDEEYFRLAMPSRSCKVEDNADCAVNNIELLAAYAHKIGCNEEAGWFRTEAVDWLQSEIGWIPRDQSWFGIETCILLAAHKGLRVWQIEKVGEGIRNMTEYSYADGNRTLPMVMSEHEQIMYIHETTIPARALSTMENLKSACAKHRHNGKFPTPPQEGPTIPNNRDLGGLQGMSRTQWAVMGFTVGVSVVIGVTAAYRKRTSLKGLVASARKALRRKDGRLVQRAAAAEAGRETSPLLGISDEYMGTEFNQDTEVGPIAQAYAEYQARVVESPTGVSAGGWDFDDVSLRLDTNAIVKESWGMSIFRRFWGSNDPPKLEL